MAIRQRRLHKPTKFVIGAVVFICALFGGMTGLVFASYEASATEATEDNQAVSHPVALPPLQEEEAGDEAETCGACHPDVLHPCWSFWIISSRLRHRP